MAGASLMIEVLPDKNNFIQKEKTRELACARKSDDLLAALTPLFDPSGHTLSTHHEAIQNCPVGMRLL
jgi:hypothetical protein